MFNLSVKTYLDQSVYSQSMLQNQGLITSRKEFFLFPVLMCVLLLFCIFHIVTVNNLSQRVNEVVGNQLNKLSTKC